MSDHLKHLNSQIASLEARIARKSLKAAQERWEDWKATAYCVQNNT